MRGIAVLVFGLLFAFASGASAFVREPITPEQAGKVDNKEIQSGRRRTSQSSDNWTV